QGALTGLLQGCGTEVVGQAQDPQGGAQCFVRMGSPVDLFAQQLGSRRPHRFSPLEQAFVAELDDGTMSLWAVRRLGDEAPAAGGVQVTRNALTAVVDLQYVPGDAQIHALADQTVRHRVVATLELDVVIEEDLGSLPGGVLVGTLRQSTQRRSVQFQKAAAARTGLARECSIVVSLQLGMQCLVELTEAEEALMPQGRQDPAFDTLDGDFYLGLVARLADPRRQDPHPIVLGKILVAGVGCPALPNRPDLPWN